MGLIRVRGYGPAILFPDKDAEGNPVYKRHTGVWIYKTDTLGRRIPNQSEFEPTGTIEIGTYKNGKFVISRVEVISENENPKGDNSTKTTT